MNTSLVFCNTLPLNFNSFSCIHRAWVVLLIGSLASCTNEYVITDLNITQQSWDELTINELYALDGFNPFLPNAPEQASISISITNAEGEEIATSTDRTIQIPDKELKSKELYTITLTSELPGQTLTTSISRYASTKKLFLNPEWLPGSDYSYFVNKLSVDAARELFGSYSGEYEITQYNISFSGSVQVALSGYYDESPIFGLDNTYPRFPSNFYNAIKQKLYGQHEANFEYKYSLFWQGENYLSSTYTYRANLQPTYNTCKDHGPWTFTLAPYEAVFFEYHISSADIGVFTLKNSGYSGNLDLYVYDDDELNDLEKTSVESSVSNDLCYVAEGGYHYVKVYNNSPFNASGWFISHNVEPDQVAHSTIKEYAVQYAVRSFFKWLFDVDDDDKFGGHLSDLAANITISGFKGEDLSGMTQNALANEMCTAFKTATTNREDANIACQFAVNLTKEVYRYDN